MGAWNSTDMCRAWWLLAWLLLACSADAQQPFATDDAGVTDYHRFHLEVSNQHDLLQRTLRPNLRQNTLSVELAYGIAPNWEIGLECPVLALFNEPGTSPRIAAGQGDASFTAKYNYRPARENSRDPALTVLVHLELPTGPVHRQLGSALVDYWLNSIVEQPLTSRTTLRGNVGVQLAGNTLTGVVGIRQRGTIVTGATSLVHAVTPRLNLGIEWFGARTKAAELGEAFSAVQVGGSYVLRPDLSLDFGVITGQSGASPRVGFQLGFAYDF